jgi:type III pantothenate kinase
LFKVELARPRSVIGKSTVEALQSGMVYGFAGQIDGLVRRISEEIDADPVVIATGGLAPLFVGATPVQHQLDPEITMRGLVEI